MINRAKCKQCSCIIESHLPDEIVYCRCGEIAVCDGPAMRMYANRIENFLRVDDVGNEIVVSYKEKDPEGQPNNNPEKQHEPPTRGELIGMLDDMIKNFDNLPDHAKASPITHYDFISLMLIISNILKRE
jgi:hypothetical protein